MKMNQRLNWIFLSSAILLTALTIGFQNCGSKGFRSVSAAVRFRGDGSSLIGVRQPETGGTPSGSPSGNSPPPPSRMPSNPPAVSPSPLTQPSRAPSPSPGPVQQETTPYSIQGVFKSVCGMEAASQQYMRETLTIGAGTISIVYDYSRSSTCTQPVQQYDYRGTYTVEASNTTGQFNQLRFGFAMQDNYEMYDDDSYIQQLNQGNACGGGWVKGVPKYVKGQSCAMADFNLSGGRVQKSGTTLVIFFPNGAQNVYWKQ